MSGLIWAGIGKGIADAGQTFGGYMAKDIESKQLAEREAQREERLLARQEALEQLKADRARATEEELQQRVIRESADISTKAQEIGLARDAAQGEKDVKGLINRQSQIAGDSPAASEEEIKKLIAENPQYKDIYRAAGYIDKEPTANQKRVQRVDDEEQAARDIGAHSSVLKSLIEKRKSVMEQIREENRVDADKRRDDRAAADRAASDRRFEALMPIRQQQADASTTRANRAPSSGGGTDRTEQDITAAENALSNARSRAEKGYPDPTVQEKHDAAAKAAYEKKKKEAIDNDPDVKRQRERVERMYSGGGAPAAPAKPKSGDNRPSTSGTTTKNYSNLWK